MLPVGLENPTMSKILSVFALVIPLLAAVPTLAAESRPVCSERAKFLNALSSVHSESPVAMGLGANGSVVGVLASKTGSWTILVTSPNGTTCVVAVGEGWETLKTTPGPTA